MPTRKTLVDLLLDWVERDPDFPGYSWLGDDGAIAEQYTYAELESRVRAVAAELASLARPGDRILLLHPPGLDFVVAYFAFENPPLMLIISGLSTVILYPILGLGTLYLRYRRVDPRIAPGRSVTLLLWLSGVAVAIISPATLLLALLIQQGWISF